jgi:hypothetical protein
MGKLFAPMLGEEWAEAKERVRCRSAHLKIERETKQAG